MWLVLIALQPGHCSLVEYVQTGRYILHTGIQGIGGCSLTAVEEAARDSQPMELEGANQAAP
jgi:hypothetical protein